MDEIQNELKHYGVLGMKWGVRRYQNKDGTLTSKGKKRYSDSEAKQKEKEKFLNDRMNARNKTLATFNEKQNEAVINKIVSGGEKDVLRMLDRMDSQKMSFDEAFEEMETRRAKILLAQVLASVGILTVGALISAS